LLDVLNDPVQLQRLFPTRISARLPAKLKHNAVKSPRSKQTPANRHCLGLDVGLPAKSSQHILLGIHSQQGSGNQNYDENIAARYQHRTL
jgi:hypothetical protein